MSRDSGETNFERKTLIFRPSERPKSTEASVVVIAGPSLGRQIVVGDAPIEIGRLSECALQLDIESVSRRHARIERAPDGHRLVDLGSTNGTLVNGVKITQHPLRDGDHLKVGQAVLKYIAGGNIEAEYHRALEERAALDPLTGVANRRRFEDTLRQLLTRAVASSAAFSLILFDIDHFKRINDSFGHPAGDSVLKMLAGVVLGEVRSDDLLARVGGEEFAVLLPGASANTARTVAERIRAAVERGQFAFDGRPIPVTVSLGVATYEIGRGESGIDLYQRADARLYEAKHAGRNCVR